MLRVRMIKRGYGACVLGMALAAIQVSANGWTAEETIALFQQLGKDQPTIPCPPAGPILLWSGLGFEAQSPENIRLLLDQGFNQHLPLTGDYRTAARALAQSGAPIQIMEGLKRFPVANQEGKTRPASAEDSFRLATWQKIGDWVRRQMRMYQDCGLTVDALWLDYEGFPFLAERAAVRSSAAGLNLPTHLNETAWADWRRQFALNALSSYVAAPARENFPNISVLNWTANFSFPHTPLIDATGGDTAVSGPLWFTHSNPYAYGNTLSYEIAGMPMNLEQSEVDAFYLELLLRHASTDARNRRSANEVTGAVVWVARIVRDAQQDGIPEMSRPAYREALRHLWLRGIDGMMVFNSPMLNPGEHQAEITDVAQVWREMSAHRPLLQRGMPANYELSAQDGCIWSAIATPQLALIRITPVPMNQAFEARNMVIWEDLTIRIPAGREPQTYLVWRNPTLGRHYLLTTPAIKF